MILIINSPRGTVDILGEEIRYRNFTINTARKLFDVYNYSEIITPTFEHTEVFSRSIGEETDIVKKEMYTFSDRKGRSLTLRPEGTASVARAFIENKMYSEYLPVKLFYIGSMFRYERPQKGRMREFYQLGVESIGTSNPMMDAEVILLLKTFFKKLGFEKLTLLINSIGCSKCRKYYIDKFKSYLKPKAGLLCQDCIQRYDKNPLRIFDCKNKQCMAIIKDSPKIFSMLCSDCKRNLEEVLKMLEYLNVEYEIGYNLVRGFDYYTGIIFEIISKDIKSAQNALGGGGRYDNLIAQFGGPKLPAVGFAVGIDRTYMLMKQLDINIRDEKPGKRTYIIVMNENSKFYSFGVLMYLRENNYICDINYNMKKLGSELKWAEKNNYDFAIIIGDDEMKAGDVSIKDLKKHKQIKINYIADKQKILEIIT